MPFNNVELFLWPIIVLLLIIIIIKNNVTNNRIDNIKNDYNGADDDDDADVIRMEDASSRPDYLPTLSAD